VGNPYPSAIDLDKFFAVNDGLIDPVAYIWGRQVDDTPNSGNPGPYPLSYSQDSFIIYNPNISIILNPNPFNVQPDGTSVGTLASCQSFFVQTTSNDGTLVFNNSIRTKIANNTFARQTTSSTDDKLWINILNEKAEKVSQTGFAFILNASEEYHSKEDVKTFRSNKTTLYSIVDNLDLIINVQSPFTNSKVIPLGITTFEKVGSQLSISIEKKQGVFNNKQIFIYDKLNNTYNDISNNNFNFIVTNKIMDDRFVLVFEKIKTKNFENTLSQIEVIDNNNVITVKSIDETKIVSVEVFDIYNFSINGLHLLTIKDINVSQESFKVDEKYKLLLLVITLENGVKVYKKITN
jgi:hypothetical protein